MNYTVLVVDDETDQRRALVERVEWQKAGFEVVGEAENGIEAIEIKGKIEILAEIKNNLGIIKISNNGKPISKEKQESIFNEGYTTKKTGCGLGLCICKKYLKSQNATLELVKSIKGQTQFEIKIPITTYSTKEENPE